MKLASAQLTAFFQYLSEGWDHLMDEIASRVEAGTINESQAKVESFRWFFNTYRTWLKVFNETFDPAVHTADDLLTLHYTLSSDVDRLAREFSSNCLDAFNKLQETAQLLLQQILAECRKRAALN